MNNLFEYYYINQYLRLTGWLIAKHLWLFILSFYRNGANLSSKTIDK